MSTAPTKRSRRKDARPSELLEAALDLFVEQGFAATRVEAVAQRAGVSKGTLFLYFDSKEALFKAVVRHHIAQLLGEWSLELDEFTGPTADLVRKAMHDWWSRIGATRLSGITRLVINEAVHFPEIAAFYQQEVIAPGNALLKRVLDRGVARGEFRGLDTELGIHSLIAPMMYLILCKHTTSPCAQNGGAFAAEAFIDQQVDILLRGWISAGQAPVSELQ